jgi:hypothetical protein
MGTKWSQLPQVEKEETVQKVVKAQQSYGAELQERHEMLGCLMCGQDYDCATAVEVDKINVCPQCAEKQKEIASKAKEMDTF